MRQYLKDIINGLKKSDTWKIQLAIANNFISSIDIDEERVMHSKSYNTEVMILYLIIFIYCIINVKNKSAL